MGNKERESFGDFLERRIKEDKIVDIDYKETISSLYDNNMDFIYQDTTLKERELTKKRNKLSGTFQSNLTKEQVEQYEKLGDLETQIQEEIYRRTFIFAYSLSNKLMVESLF